MKDDEITSPTKSLDSPLSSILPKKREKFLSTHVLPTSTTSEEDEEIPVSSSINMENVELLADSVDEILGDHSEVIAVTPPTTGMVIETSGTTQALNTAVFNQ